MIRRSALALVVAALLMLISLLSLRIVAASSQNTPLVQTSNSELVPPWKQAFQRIEADRLAGRLSIDETALLRFQAISEPLQLPAPYRPDPQVIEQWLARSAAQANLGDGMPRIAEGLAALTADVSLWSEETRRTIFEQMEQRDRQGISAVDTVTETAHFRIHWDESGGPDTPSGCTTGSCSYVKTISDTLEAAWSEYETLGYTMPETGYFENDDTELINVFVVQQSEVVPCEMGAFSPFEPGISFPGQIRFRNDVDPATRLQPLVAHELYHQMQWRAIGFSGSGCFDWTFSVGEWYGDLGNAWLLEDTAVWAEAHLFPTESLTQTGRYRTFARRYFQEEKTRSSFFDITYDGTMFFTLLEEHLASAAGYTQSQDIVLDIWEAMANQDVCPLDICNPFAKSTEQAVTTVLEGLPDEHDTWKEVFATFATTNYLQDYHYASIFQPPPVAVSVPIEADLQPVANPPTPLTGGFSVAKRPSVLYYEISPTLLNVADGPDATGATLGIEFTSSCPDCTLEALVFNSGELTPTQRLSISAAPDPSGVSWMYQTQVLTYGVSTGPSTVALALVNASAANNSPYYDGSFTITATDNLPISPTLLTASADTTNDEIDLLWTPVQEEGIQYRIYRSEGVTPTLLATVPATPTLYSDDTAVAGVVYTYTVRALDTGDNEGPPSPAATGYLPCGAPLDVYYVLDHSISMSEPMDSESEEPFDKIDAAKQVITETNQLLASFGDGSRAGLITFKGPRGAPWSPLNNLRTRVTLTDTLAAIENQFWAINPQGQTPTAHAIEYAGDQMAATLNPDHTPVLIMLSDGGPTISLRGIFYMSWYAETVDITDPEGNFLSIGEVRELGCEDPEDPNYLDCAGEAYADAMQAIHDFKAAHPTFQFHGVAFPSTPKGPDLIRYIAEVGGGEFVMGSDQTSLREGLARILHRSACSAPPPTPTPSPTATTTASPTPTASPSETATPTATVTLTASSTPTSTETPTATATSSVTATRTPTRTPRPTRTPTAIVTPSATPTP